MRPFGYLDSSNPQERKAWICKKVNECLEKQSVAGSGSKTLQRAQQLKGRTAEVKVYKQMDILHPNKQLLRKLG